MKKGTQAFFRLNFPIFSLAVPAAKCYYIRVRYETT